MAKVCFLLAMDLRKTDGATVHSKNLLRACESAGIKTQTVSFDSLGCSGVEWALRAPGAVAEDVGAVYVRSPFALASVLLLKAKRKKVILGVAALKHLESPAWMRPFVKLAEDAAIRSSDAVMTISPALEKYCRAHGAEKTLVYLPPVAVSAASARRRRGKFVVGYAGGNQEWQGLPLLLEAVPRVRGDFEVRIYGDAEKTAADARVKFLGRIPNSRVPSALRSLDLFVLPRPRHPSAETAMPIKLVEAMACGVPCLVTDVGGVSWFVKDGRDAIVREPSAEGVASGIAWALRNRKKLRAIGENGRKRVTAELRGTGWKIRRLVSSLD